MSCSGERLGSTTAAGSSEAIRNRNKKPTSPGKDMICYMMLKHLGEGALSKLLQFYNKIWKEGRLPSTWKEAVVIPIRKPGKDPHIIHPSYDLEKKEMLANHQSGFRKGRNSGCRD